MLLLYDCVGYLLRVLLFIRDLMIRIIPSIELLIDQRV